MSFIFLHGASSPLLHANGSTTTGRLDDELEFPVDVLVLPVVEVFVVVVVVFATAEDEVVAATEDEVVVVFDEEVVWPAMEITKRLRARTVTNFLIVVLKIIIYDLIILGI